MHFFFIILYIYIHLCVYICCLYCFVRIDVGHHCNKIHSFCSKIFIRKYLNVMYMVVKRKKSSGVISKNEGFCKDLCSVLCSVKLEASSPWNYVYVGILILPNLPLKSEESLLSSRLLFSFYCSWPTVDPLRMISVDFFNVWFFFPFGMVIFNVRVHAYSDIRTPTHCHLPKARTLPTTLLYRSFRNT